LRRLETALIFYHIQLQIQDFYPLPPYLCANFRNGMTSGRIKSLLVAVFSVFFISFFNSAIAGDGGNDSTHKKEAFNAKEIIFGHVLDAKEFHFLDIKNKDGSHQPVSIPLPVILYSPQRGLSVFMSSKFHHGEKAYKNYIILNDVNI